MDLEKCGACGREIVIDYDTNYEGTRTVESVLNGFRCQGGCERPVHSACVYHTDVCNECCMDHGGCEMTPFLPGAR